MSLSKKKKQSNGAAAEAQFLDYCSLSHGEMKALAKSSCTNGDDELRFQAFLPMNSVTTSTVTAIQPMHPLAHFCTMLFLAFGVPNGVFTIPAVLFLIGKFVVHDVKATFGVAAVLLLPLAILPQPFLPWTLTSWMACQVVKYFSFRFISEAKLSRNDDNVYIFVAPPHGVFPYGNILSMLIFPALHGFHFNGLAASSALRVPGFKQILRSIGVIDASRNVATTALDGGNSIGISTGGVREVFETNHEHECILLKERKGMIKLAIRTGASLVPCYMFGNTSALGCWAGEGIPGNGAAKRWLEAVSRRVGFALIVIYGRFGLPIPFRVPILGVHGKPISTKHLKCEQPTEAQVDEIQQLLLKDMHELFERYKDLYGWQETDLIIK